MYISLRMMVIAIVASVVGSAHCGVPPLPKDGVRLNRTLSNDSLGVEGGAIGSNGVWNADNIDTDANRFRKDPAGTVRARLGALKAQGPQRS